MVWLVRGNKPKQACVAVLSSPVVPIFSLAVSVSANRVACGTRCLYPRTLSISTKPRPNPNPNLSPNVRFDVVVFDIDVNLLHNQSSSKDMAREGILRHNIRVRVRVGVRFKVRVRACTCKSNITL